METFLRLFGGLLSLVYHCFDRIVIFGYLPLLSRPEHIVCFFRDVAGVGASTKDVLGKRTGHDNRLLGRVLRAQPQHPHRVGRERGPQRRLHPSRLAAHRAPKTLWRLLHPPTHGSRHKLSLRRAQVSHRRSRLPYPPQDSAAA